MSIDLKQLEINFNLHSLQPTFLNYELHYIIASSENAFRFAAWDEEQKEDEQKFYCFLSETELFIPAGNITLNESYVLSETPVYPLLRNAAAFIEMIERVPEEHGVAKGIRHFAAENVPTIKQKLCDKYGDCEQHLVTSSEAQHMLFVVKDIEISISATMVYFRWKAPFAEKHYAEVKAADA